jgi:hypothetical protein
MQAMSMLGWSLFKSEAITWLDPEPRQCFRMMYWTAIHACLFGCSVRRNHSTEAAPPRVNIVPMVSIAVRFQVPI